MARLARVVVPGLPHHVTQRGNRRQQTFFGAADYQFYKDLLAEHAAAAGVQVWAWCLLPNHVHLLLVPADADGLRAALGEAHRRYSSVINRRFGWRGFLWQGRFASAVCDPGHALAAARYAELNPVRAGLGDQPEDWSWSSARAHLGLAADGLTAPSPLTDAAGDWRAFLAAGLAPDEAAALRRGERTGRPLGDAAFIAALEAQTGRRLAPRRPGRPRRRDG